MEEWIYQTHLQEIGPGWEWMVEFWEGPSLREQFAWMLITLTNKAIIQINYLRLTIPESGLIDDYSVEAGVAPGLREFFERM